MEVKHINDVEATPGQTFTGLVAMKRLFPMNLPDGMSVGLVRFENGARTNWHQHEGEQVLIIAEGEGRAGNGTQEFLNLGPGTDVPIVDLVKLVCAVVGFKGGVHFDSSRPDGVPRKMVDTTLATSLGWRARTPLRQGLAATYRWYVDNVAAEPRAVA